MYTSVGALNGALFSIFFKRKVPVIGYFAGLGLGLAVHRNANKLIKHVRRQKD